MSFSYSENPAASALDQVRFLIGDTDFEDPLLSDQEIKWVLSQYNNAPMNAAIRCCETLVSKFSRLANESVGSVKVEYNQIVNTYLKITLPMLKSRLATEDRGVGFYAGGISKNDKLMNANNPDRVRPDFSKHMMENYALAPWTTQNEYAQFLMFGD